MEEIKEAVEVGISNTQFYMSEYKSPFGMVFLVISNTTENQLSVNCSNGKITATHFQISEYPSILPKSNGEPREVRTTYVFGDANKLVQWILENMDTSIDV